MSLKEHKQLELKQHEQLTTTKIARNVFQLNLTPTKQVTNKKDIVDFLMKIMINVPNVTTLQVNLRL